MGPFIFCFCVTFVLEQVGVSALVVSLKNNSPVVLGSNITFTASVLGYNGEYLKFIYSDNAQPQHKDSVTISANISTWTVEYPRDLYEVGEYTATVKLMKDYFGIWIPESSDHSTFRLTDTLNGKLVLNQNNTDRPNNFVAVNKTVLHYVQLPDQEMQFLKENSSSIVTHWFIDCVFFGSTTDFSLNYTYNDTMSDHHIEAIIVANNEPLPPIITTTASPTTTTTIANTTTVDTTTTTPLPKAIPMFNSSVIPTTPSTTTLKTLPMENVDNANLTLEHKIEKRAISNRTFKKYGNDYTCNNTVPIGKRYTYGRFHQTLSVRDPISTVNITGLNWLQHGDLLNLQVKYTGSPPFNYCIQYKLGQYNITGNETCSSKITTVSNTIPLVHYFSDSDQHTVVAIIENDIGKVAVRATITIYKVPLHAQLSVIVVPVFFCLLAVILVVFGIAYYQHRSRHTVEVADFDFGEEHPEYKTFVERLRDSFRNAFSFRNHDDTDPLTPDTRYDSMT